MEFLKFLLSGGLIFIAVTGEVPNSSHITCDEYILPLKINYLYPDGKTNYSLGTDIIPRSYDVTLYLYNETDLSGGTSAAGIKIVRDVYDIRLQSMNMSIQSFELVNSTGIYHPKDVCAEETGLVIFRFDSVIKASNYIVRINFVYDSTNPGFFKTSYINSAGRRAWLIASLSTPFGARRLFPCWDEPSFTAPFYIYIFHPARYKALSNMPVNTKHLDQYDRMETNFDGTPQMAAYLVGFVLIEMTDPIDSHFWYRQQVSPYVKYAFNIMKNITIYFEQRWRSLRQPPKTDYVIIPDFPRIMQVNLGLVIFREADIIYNETSNDFITEMRIIRLVAQAVAYQWLGNLASPKWWDSLWLIESLATFLAVDAIDAIFAESNLHFMDLFIIQTRQESLYLDTNDFMQPLKQEVIERDISKINSLSPNFNHVKASCILRMLQYILTEEVFRQGLYDYMRNDRLYSMSVDDFWATMQAVYVEMKIVTYPLTIQEIMTNWTTQRNYPILEVKRVNSSYVRISAETSAHNDSLAHCRYYIPLTLTTRASSDFTSFKNMIIRNNFTHPMYYYSNINEDWMIVNLQGIGYYRVNYDDKNWNKISIYLNSDNYTKIHVINRAQIIDDAFHFVITGRLKFSMFVDIIHYLHQDMSFLPWYSMFKALEYMSFYLPFEESEYMKYKLIPTLDKIALNNRNIFNTPIFNRRVHNFSLVIDTEIWRCAFGSKNCLDTVTAVVEEDVFYSDGVLLPGKEWTYCTGLMEAKHDIVQKMLNTDKRYYVYKFLYCNKNSKIIMNFIDILAEDTSNEIINSYDRINIFYNIIARHVRNDEVLDYILAKLQRFKPWTVRVYTAYAYIINNIYSKQQLTKIKEHVEKVLLMEQSIYVTKVISSNYYFIKLTKSCLVCIDELQECIMRYKRTEINRILHKISIRFVQIEKHKEKFQYFN